MLEIVAGVIGKKIVEQAGCAIFGLLQSTSAARAGLVLVFVPTTGWAEGNPHEAATLSHLIALFVSDFSGSQLMLEQELCADGSQVHVGIVGPVYRGVQVPGHRSWLVEPLLKCHIESNRFRPKCGRSSARHHSQKPALALAQESGSNGQRVGR